MGRGQGASEPSVGFEEAASVFADPCYILRQDELRSDRFHAVGMSAFAHVLTVVHVERGAFAS